MKIKTNKLSILNCPLSIVSDMDAEIAALEKQRDKTRAVKLGMMQVLLTGKIRLTAN